MFITKNYQGTMTILSETVYEDKEIYGIEIDYKS